MFLEKLPSNISYGSQKKILIECDFKESENCLNQYFRSYRDIIRYRKDNKGKDICLKCSRRLKSTGINNPNCKYKDFNHSLFKNIDCPNVSYLLGWIASDGCIQKGTIIISIKESDYKILLILSNLFNCKFEISNGMARLLIHSIEATKDICELLSINPGKKSYDIKFPEMLRNDLKWDFLRGYFDGDGHIRKLGKNHFSPECSISSKSKDMLNSISDFTKIKNNIHRDAINFYGTECLDFLGKIYYDKVQLYLDRKKNLYNNWASWSPGLVGLGGRINNFTYSFSDSRAKKPFKERTSDSGYDLTLIEKIKVKGEVEIYDTFVKIRPDYGFYFDLVPRSSIIDSGYILANSIGIIDRSYVGTIKVPLIKIDKNKPDLELPIRCVQLIPRTIIHMESSEVDKLQETNRGGDGFGSTGK